MTTDRINLVTGELVAYAIILRIHNEMYAISLYLIEQCIANNKAMNYSCIHDLIVMSDTIRNEYDFILISSHKWF